MFTREEFTAWCHAHQVSEQTQTLIHQIRASGPVRRVGGGRANVSGRYPSRKMGVMIQFESHRVELAAIYEWEHDADVVEYYDQPSSLLLDYRSASGRRVVVRHTPDYFVIRHQSAEWVECKTEEELRRLTQHTPNRYAWDGAAWRCPPGEAYASRFGLHYRVWSAQHVNWVWQRNLQFLDDYLRMNTLPCDPHICEQVVAQVVAAPGQSLEAVIVATQEIATRDQLYLMIAAGDLYVDLQATPLVEPSRVLVFPSKAIARVDVPSRVPHPNPADLRPNVTSDALPASAGQVLPLLSHARTQDLQVANRRHAILRRVFRGEPLGPDEHIPGRTLRRWRARYDEAERAGGSGYLGLLPQTAVRGNAHHKLPEATRAVLSDVIAKEYETLKQKTKVACWAAVKVACEAQGLRAPSYKTVRAAIGQRAGYRQMVTRKGHRAAYAQEPFYWELTPTTPRHGDRPFEIVHIDHTELDLQTVCSRTGRPLGRPWLTLLIDAYSRRILAFALLYDPPSYRSCMMVVRACVQRHERLPQILVVDGGREVIAQ